MKIAFQRTVDRTIGPLVCRLLSLFIRRDGGRPAAPPRRIWVILLSEMGSLVLCRPMFDRLAERYPRAAVSLLVFHKNREIPRILGLVPARRIVTVRNDNLPVFFRDVWRALRRMRAEGADVVIDCELFARVSSIIGALSGAALQVGFHPLTMEGLYRGGFVNRPVPYNPYRHMAAQFLALAEAVDADTRPATKAVQLKAPKRVAPMPVDPQRLAAFRRALHARFPQLAEGPLVLLHPGGGELPLRAWPLAHYCRLCAGLVRAGYPVGVIGLPSDRPLAAAIRRDNPSPLVADLTGATASVAELLLLLHAGALLVTNDGGPGHFAALTPIASIVFFGPETPDLYRPLDPEAVVFYRALPCSPCLTAFNHRESCCDGDNRCLKGIAPEEVLAKALSMLAPVPGGDRSYRGATLPGWQPYPHPAVCGGAGADG